MAGADWPIYYDDLRPYCGSHAMGSCRMGREPKTSVVIKFCQAHGLENLFICDTSVFVNGAGVNPTLTAMAIASRAAEQIAGSARRGELCL